MDVLLEESTTEKIPILLEDICKELISQDKSSDALQKDLFFVLIVVIMRENGFLPKSQDVIETNSANCINTEQLLKWKQSGGSYEVLYLMKGFDNLPIKLIMSPLGSTFIVNTFIDRQIDVKSDVYAVCIPTSRYVVSPHASTIPMIFRDLKHLCYTFKNKIIAPVKSIILNYNGYSSASFIGLPEEILFYILMYLPISDIISIEKLCRRMKVLLDNDNIWHHLFLRDFKNVTVSGVADWKAQYKETYISKTRSIPSRLTSGTLHDLMDVSDYVSYIDNPLWDVII